MTQPAPPARQYSFTGFQVSNPNAPPPGDKLDSEYTRTNKAISDVIAWVGTSLNSDGSLRAAPAAAPSTVDTGDAAQAFLYANLAGAWAEHMPDTIPPDVLAAVAVTGDHWSSRWWANYALQLIRTAAAGGIFGGGNGVMYRHAQPVSGDTVTALAGTGMDAIRLDPAAELAALTVVMPPLPINDGAIFWLSTTRTIDTLTINAAAGCTMAGLSGGDRGVLSANGSLCWQYNLAGHMWLPA